MLAIYERVVGPVGSTLVYMERLAPGGLWVGSTVHEGVASVPGLSALALDASGTPHVCMDTWDEELVYATRVDGTWTREVIDASVTDHYCALAFDAGGALHLISGTSSAIHHRVRTAGSWSSPETFGVAGPLGPIALRIDDAGRPHATYPTQLSARTALVHAWRGP